MKTSLQVFYLKLGFANAPAFHMFSWEPNRLTN